jgi:hypothetical protein
MINGGLFFLFRPLFLINTTHNTHCILNILVQSIDLDQVVAEYRSSTAKADVTPTQAFRGTGDVGGSQSTFQASQAAHAAPVFCSHGLQVFDPALSLTALVVWWLEKRENILFLLAAQSCRDPGLARESVLMYISDA